MTSRQSRSQIKVEAIQGQRSHGPFRFKFSWLNRTPGGEYRLTDSFEADVRISTCSSARVIPSPTGNGFLLSFWPYDAFYGRDGTLLYELHTRIGNSGGGPGCVLSEDEFSVGLHKPTLQDGVISREPAGRLFLPLGMLTGSDQDKELLAALEAGWTDLDLRRKQIENRIGKLDDEALTVRDQAHREILAQHLYAVDVVQDALAKNPPVETKARLESILRMLRVWRHAGGVKLLHNLRLLASLQSYPDDRIIKAAKRHLLSILPSTSADPLSDKGPSEWWQWADRHSDGLVWDEKRRRYASR